MKTLIIYLCTILFCPSIFTQDEHAGELIIWNRSTNNQSIRVKVYPVSMVFNGFNEYNLNAEYISYPPNTYTYNYINARNVGNYEKDVSPGFFYLYNHDNSNANFDTYGCVGYGVYKIEIRKLPNLEFIDTCTVEFDAGYPGGLSADITIFFRDDYNRQQYNMGRHLFK